MKEAKATIRMLQSSARAETPGEWRRMRARGAWALEMAQKLREAQRQMHERCCAAVDHLDEEAFERLCDEEQAKVDAIRAEIDAVVKHGKWPRHLHWGGI